MARPSKYPTELRERAVRMVIESRSDYDTDTAAMRSVAAKLGITSLESLRKWVRQAEVDGGVRQGKTTEEIAEIKSLRKENAELRRANEILKAASAFFAAELCATRRCVCREVVRDHPRWVVAAA
jgi:transposase